MSYYSKPSYEKDILLVFGDRYCRITLDENLYNDLDSHYIKHTLHNQFKHMVASINKNDRLQYLLRVFKYRCDGALGYMKGEERDKVTAAAYELLEALRGKEDY